MRGITQGAKLSAIFIKVSDEVIRVLWEHLLGLDAVMLWPLDGVRSPLIAKLFMVSRSNMGRLGGLHT